MNEREHLSLNPLAHQDVKVTYAKQIHNHTSVQECSWHAGAGLEHLCQLFWSAPTTISNKSTALRYIICTAIPTIR